MPGTGGEVRMPKQRWSEQSTARQVATIVLGVIQVSLAILAWTDLARRPADQINGSKPRWAGIIAINYIGPILYFVRGRRPAR
jgi:Phospholipase_D-nuclease N-terminal